MQPIYLWLLTGVVLIAAEVIGISGIGLLFAGLGALTVGAVIQLGLVSEEATLLQFTICFFATVIWAMLLWKLFKGFRLHKPKEGYSNILGDTAYVGSQGLSKTASGEVTWSGTIMKAELARNARIDQLEAGTQVTVVEVKGTTLVVKPKE